MKRYSGKMAVYQKQQSVGRMMQKLERTTFESSRAAEYFDARQLSTLTGVPTRDFAGVCLKELVDNALDACETSGVAPEVEVEAWEFAYDVLAPWVESARAIGHDELTEVMERALKECQDVVNSAIEKRDQILEVRFSSNNA
jgi:hypothetical protein